MKKKTLVIGTRGSALALWQADLVSQKLLEHFDGEVRLEVIKTTADMINDVPLSRIGEVGLFVKEIETALLEGRIDIAVHSMKDMPTLIPAGLHIAGVLQREDPRDAFISHKYKSIRQIDSSTIIATSSLRRKAQVMHLCPQVKVVDIRGNVDTRIKKLQDGYADASIMALAGLKRMGFTDHVAEILDTELMLPAAGQGCIAIEARLEDKWIKEVADKITSRIDFISVRAERELMRRLEGGCQVPIGALAVVHDDEISLEAMVASLDGSILLREAQRGSIAEPEELGKKTAECLIKKGAREILAGIRKKNA